MVEKGRGAARLSLGETTGLVVELRVWRGTPSACFQSVSAAALAISNKPAKTGSCSRSSTC